MERCTNQPRRPWRWQTRHVLRRSRIPSRLWPIYKTGLARGATALMVSFDDWREKQKRKRMVSHRWKWPGRPGPIPSPNRRWRWLQRRRKDSGGRWILWAQSRCRQLGVCARDPCLGRLLERNIPCIGGGKMSMVDSGLWTKSRPGAFWIAQDLAIVLFLLVWIYIRLSLIFFLRPIPAVVDSDATLRKQGCFNVAVGSEWIITGSLSQYLWIIYIKNLGIPNSQTRRPKTRTRRENSWILSAGIVGINIVI